MHVVKRIEAQQMTKCVSFERHAMTIARIEVDLRCIKPRIRADSSAYTALDIGMNIECSDSLAHLGDGLGYPARASPKVENRRGQHRWIQERDHRAKVIQKPTCLAAITEWFT